MARPAKPRGPSPWRMAPRSPRHPRPGSGQGRFVSRGLLSLLAWKGMDAVSYTHLTLPTICSV
eukprot:4828328-Alexandrium_andersonii.AAC.1